jgi:hypothetical protein
MLYYGATIALSAFLLFLVQPIIAKQILPWFGGSAAVWTTCMVFFQCTLLAGYFYSDFLARRLSLKKQVMVHAGLLILSLAFLPITASQGFKPIDADNPIGRILLLLLVTIGLPYFMLSTTGPLVQAWFVKRFPQGTAKSFNVYRLYALSNVASMLALIAYPPLIEPFASGKVQSWGWSLGYVCFVALAGLVIPKTPRRIRLAGPGLGWVRAAHRKCQQSKNERATPLARPCGLGFGDAAYRHNSHYTKRGLDPFLMGATAGHLSHYLHSLL